MSAAAASPCPTATAIAHAQSGAHITRAEMAEAFLPILESAFPGADVAWGALFAALHARGPACDEILGLLDAIMRFDPQLAEQLYQPADLGTVRSVAAITGSGKETFKTFNVSTAAAFVAACHPDVCVIKPAGRATSAVTGASDVLEALGIRLPTSLTQVTEMARRAQLGVFDYHLVAPRYGPRYEGRFHHLHPLSHVTPWLFIPIRLDGLVFGVAEPRVDLAASVMDAVKTRNYAVVSTQLGEHGCIDELAPFGAASLIMRTDGPPHRSAWDHFIPADLHLIAQRPVHEANAAFVRDVLSDDGPVTARQLVCENAALILRVAGVAPSQEAGRDLAEKFIRNGEATRRLETCQRVSREVAGA